MLWTKKTSGGDRTVETEDVDWEPDEEVELEEQAARAPLFGKSEKSNTSIELKAAKHGMM